MLSGCDLSINPVDVARPSKEETPCRAKTPLTWDAWEHLRGAAKDGFGVGLE